MWQVRLAEAQRVLHKLVSMRETARSRLLSKLEDYWAQTNTPIYERQDVKTKAAGLDAASLQLLQNHLEERRYEALAPVMRKVQSELSAQWAALKLPESQREAFAWTEGEPLTDPQVKACQTELNRLDEWQSQLGPVLMKVSQDVNQQKVVSEVLAGLHGGVVMKAKKAAEAHKLASQAELLEPEVSYGGGAGGGEDAADAPAGSGGGSGMSSDAAREQMREMQRVGAEQMRSMQQAHERQLQAMKQQLEYVRQERTQS